MSATELTSESPWILLLQAFPLLPKEDRVWLLVLLCSISRNIFSSNPTLNFLLLLNSNIFPTASSACRKSINYCLWRTKQLTVANALACCELNRTKSQKSAARESMRIFFFIRVRPPDQTWKRCSKYGRKHMHEPPKRVYLTKDNTFEPCKTNSFRINLQFYIINYLWNWLSL